MECNNQRWAIFVSYILLLLAGSSEGVSGNCAKNVMWSTKTSQQFNKDSQEYVTKTKISFSIGLHETVCFQIEDKDGTTADRTVDGRNYYFSLENVKSIYNYKNAYTFGIGKPEVKCLCDCPGIEDHCSPSRDSCREDENTGNTCFNYYSDDQSAKGCGITSFLGTAEVCCSVNVRPLSTTKYTAFEISAPVTRSTFRMEKDEPFESRFFASDLGTGSPHFDDNLQISFLNSGKTNPLPAGWYFGEAYSEQTYTNMNVNGLLEWDINKLGWYKYKNGRFSTSQTAVKNAFNSFTLNCDNSDMDVTFYSENNMTYAKTLKEFYASTISKSDRSDVDRTLALQYFDFSKINVFITVEGKKKVTLRYNMPSFLDFTGSAMFDKHSNRFLNISIINGKGTLYGAMKMGKGLEDNFHFIIPDEGKVLNYTNYVQITQWCNVSMVIDLCFHAGDNREKCKVIECNEEPLMNFALPHTAIDYEKVHKPNFFGLETWKKYLNPLEWFNGIDNWQEGIIMLISSALYVVLLSIFIKMCTCFKCGAHLFLKVSQLCCRICSGGRKTIKKKLAKRASCAENIELAMSTKKLTRSASYKQKSLSIPNSPAHSVKSTRSNISQKKHRKQSNQEGRYKGSGMKSARQHSFQSERGSFRNPVKRSLTIAQSYSDTDLIRGHKTFAENRTLRNEFVNEFGKRKLELFEQMIHEYDGNTTPDNTIPDIPGTAPAEECVESSESLNEKKLYYHPYHRELSGSRGKSNESHAKSCSPSKQRRSSNPCRKQPDSCRICSPSRSKLSTSGHMYPSLAYTPPQSAPKSSKQPHSGMKVKEFLEPHREVLALGRQIEGSCPPSYSEICSDNDTQSDSSTGSSSSF